MKEILLYGGIWEWSVSQFIKAMEEAKDQDVVVRVNTYGGSPQDAFGIVAKMAEHKKNITVKVDGNAQSTGAFLLCYAAQVSALDVSKIMFHRAAYPRWFEANKEYMTEPMWEELNKLNKNLRAAMEGKIDVAKFEAVAGVTLDELFSNDTRIDVTLTAEQAKEIGLVDEIVKITPEIRASIESEYSRIAALAPLPESAEPSKATTNSETNKKTVTMTIEKLKAEHPDVYAATVAAGVAQERDRVGAWLAFADIDAERVHKAITAGEELSQTATAELTVKAASMAGLKKIATDSVQPVATGEDEGKTTAEAEADAFFSAVKSNLKA